MSQIIFMAAVGVIVLGARLTALQIIGVAMAATSIFLITGFGAGAGEG